MTKHAKVNVTADMFSQNVKTMFASNDLNDPTVVPIPSSGRMPYVREHAIQCGNHMITPTLAAYLLKECKLEIQEKRTKTGGDAIAKWVECMDRGYWQQFSQITLCALPDGKMYLINGYHRLNGVVAYRKEQSFNVVVIECANIEEVESRYAQMDRAQFIRLRSDTTAMNAIRFSEGLGISKTVATAFWNTLPILFNGVSRVRHGDTKTKTEMALIEVRACYGFEWAAEIRDYNALITAKGVNPRNRQRLLIPAVIAVALMTLRYVNNRAIDFWGAVALDDGLRSGSPQHTLVRTLAERRFVGGDGENLIVPAVAWNAYYNRRGLSSIRSGASDVLRIAGTPIGRAK